MSNNVVQVSKNPQSVVLQVSTGLKGEQAYNDFTGTPKTLDYITNGPNADIRAFGAVGDGVTDDTAAIQAAVDYLGLRGGGTLTIPQGTYAMIASSPTILAPKRILIPYNNIHIVGTGMPTIKMLGIDKAYIDSIDDYSSSGRDVFTAFSFRRVVNCSVKNVRFEGTWDGVGGFRFASPRAKGIGFLGGSDCIVENCYGYNLLGNLVNCTPSSTTYDGAYQQVHNIKIVNSHASQCLENGFNYMGDTYNCSISGCSAKLCGSTGIESGCYGYTASGNICTGNKAAGMAFSGKKAVISNNVLNDNGTTEGISSLQGNGIQITGGSDVTVSKNHIEGNRGFGGYVYPGVSKVRFINNTMKDNQVGNVANTNYGVYMVGTAIKPIDDCYVAGNHVEETDGNMLYAVVVEYANRIEITGNTLVQNAATTYSVLVQANCTDINVHDNNVNKPVTISTSATGSRKYSNVGDKRNKSEGTAAPTTGTHAVGDIHYNTAPSVGTPEVWRCTVAGTPGTWVPSGIVGNTESAGYEFKSADATLTGLNRLIVVDATSGPKTITLPLASAAIPGREIIVRKYDSSANAVTIVAQGSDVISASSVTSLTIQGTSTSFMTSGVGTWYGIDGVTGNTSALTTTAKGSAVAAINEINGHGYTTVPASATAAGTPGQYAADASYFYTCHATNTWKRVAIATW
jgi:hypothetical protein